MLIRFQCEECGRGFAIDESKAGAAVPVIVASGYSEQAPAELRETGASAFLQKPYRGEDLVALVQRVLGEA